MKRIGLAALAPATTALVATMWLAIGCGLAGTSGSSRAPLMTSVGSAGSTMAPSATTITLAQLTAAPSARPSLPSSEPSSVEATDSAQPPDGVLSTSETVVTGHLGTFCWKRACSDEFELPAKPSLPLVAVAATDAPLSFELASDVAFTKWSASYSTGTMAGLVPVAGGGSVYDQDSTATAPPPVGSVEFPAPPAGDWALVVSVHFADASGLVSGGDANYVWHVVVQ
jgi:hypothetical protein